MVVTIGILVIVVVGVIVVGGALLEGAGRVLCLDLELEGGDCRFE